MVGCSFILCFLCHSQSTWEARSRSWAWNVVVSAQIKHACAKSFCLLFSPVLFRCKV